MSAYIYVCADSMQPLDIKKTGSIFIKGITEEMQLILTMVTTTLMIMVLCMYTKMRAKPNQSLTYPPLGVSAAVTALYNFNNA